ncbi:hypothetical protein EJB05_45163, partial [Eragrostis curvula]
MKEIMVEEHADGEPIPPLIQRMEEAEEEVMPQWLHVLLRTRFWKPCSRGHKDENRAEDCLFCVQCYKVFCPHCTHDEPGHRLLKICRYVYRSVVLVKDMHELNIDVSSIQTYFTNGQNGVLLRPMRRSPHFRPKAGAPQCKTCACWLHSTPHLFCSLTCKGKVDVSQEDFSGPEAERRFKKLQTNMAQLPEDDNDIELPVEAPPLAIPPKSVEAPPVEIPLEPIVAPPVVSVPEPVEAAPVVIPPEPVEAPPIVIPPGVNNSNRRRPRKQAKPQRAPFF